MISAMNGFDVACRQSIRDKWDISAFKGKVTKLDGFEITEPKKKNFNDGGFSESKSRDKRNKKNKACFAARRDSQMVLLQKYIDLSSERGRWVALVRMSGTCITSSHISRCAQGETTVANSAEWKKIEVAIEKFIAEKESEHSS